MTTKPSHVARSGRMVRSVSRTLIDILWAMTITIILLVNFRTWFHINERVETFFFFGIFAAAFLLPALFFQGRTLGEALLDKLLGLEQPLQSGQDPYSALSPPFLVSFGKVSPRKLRALYKWYMTQTPIRMSMLQNAVRQATGNDGWPLDYSPRSLEALGAWFAEQAEAEPQNPREAKEPAKQSSDEAGMKKHQLTWRTFSVAMDVGTYVAECLKRQFPHLIWQQKGSEESPMDMGLPVLSGFEGGASFNPLTNALQLAAEFASGAKPTSALRDLYEVWAEIVPSAAKSTLQALPPSP